MSYDIVRKISVRDGRVFITSTPNNIYPHDYHEWECPELTRALEEGGQEGLGIEFDKYTRSGKYLQAGTHFIHAILVGRDTELPTSWWCCERSAAKIIQVRLNADAVH